MRGVQGRTSVGCAGVVAAELVAREDGGSAVGMCQGEDCRELVRV
jgi:hypothetical protein